MRLKNRELSLDDAKGVLEHCEYGVLSLCDSGKPYAVPVNYAYCREENCVFIHSAKVGKKIEVLTENPSATLVAVELSEVLQEKYTTKYRSVIVSGKISVLADNAERYKALFDLCERFVPGGTHKKEIDKFFERVAVLRLDVETISGKHNKDG